MEAHVGMKNDGEELAKTKYHEELDKLRGDILQYNAALMNDIIVRFEWEERARIVADERIEKVTDAAILHLEAKITDCYASQRTRASKLEPTTTVCANDDFPVSANGACQGLHADSGDVHEDKVALNARIDELSALVQAQLMSETSLREEMKNVISLFDQEQKARISSSKEFEHKFQQVQTIMKDELAQHHFLQDGVMEQIQKTTDELISFHLRLDQLDEKFSSENNIKEIVLQELGDVKRGLERCVIETSECQGGLKELRSQMAAESLQHEEQFKVHAALVNNESLERQEVFKAHVKSMSETLNDEILEGQGLKTNTRLDNDAVMPESPNFGSVVTPRSRLKQRTGSRSPMRLQHHDNCVRAIGPVQRVAGLGLPKAVLTQGSMIKPPFRTGRSTQNRVGSASVTTSVLPIAKHGMQPREGSTTPRRFRAAASASVTPVSPRSFSSVPALIKPLKIQNSPHDQLIDKSSRQHNCGATPRAVFAQ